MFIFYYLQAIYRYNRLIESNWKAGEYERIFVTGGKMYDRIQYFDDEILVARVYFQETNTNANIDIINLSTGNVSIFFVIPADLQI